MPDNVLNKLLTPRLRLSRMCADDLDDLTRIYRDPQVMATLGGVRAAIQTAEYLDCNLALYRLTESSYLDSLKPR